MSQNDPTDPEGGDHIMAESAPESPAEQEEILISYLYHLLYAVQLLLSTEDDDDENMSNTEGNIEAEDHEGHIAELRKMDPRTSPQQLFESLSRALLQCCSLDHMARPLTRRQLRECRALLAPEETEHHSDPITYPVSPSIISLEHYEQDVMQGKEPQHFPDAAKTAYRFRRIDAVRRVLRSAAPVALDLVAHIVHHGVGDHDSTATYMLLCIWLPVAPHTMPLVTRWLEQSKQNPMAVIQELYRQTSSSYSAQVNLLLEVTWILCQSYKQQRESHTLRDAVDWGPLFIFLNGPDADGSDTLADAASEEVEMTLDEDASSSDIDYITRDEWTDALEGTWYTMRILAWIQSYAPVAIAILLKTHRVYYDDMYVPWRQHPFDVEDEELVFQKHHFLGRTILLGKATVPLPDLPTVRSNLALHPSLLDFGHGLLHVRHSHGDPSRSPSSLIPTATTARNLHHLGMALCQTRPILLCGPAGAGKSSLIRAVATEFQSAYPLLELHVDEETDGKTLVGSVRATDLPGEFAWSPGPLARAVETGQWVLLEDLDTVSLTDLQSTLEPLWKYRQLPLGNGETLRCHANFRFFATLRTDDLAVDDEAHRGQPIASLVGRRRILSPSLWTMVYVNPLTIPELKEIALQRHCAIPPPMIDATLSVFQALEDARNRHSKLWMGRQVSVRDVWKVLSRISNTVSFESNTSYTTESQRTLCLMEVVDVFVAACPTVATRRDFIASIVAPTFQLTADAAIAYVERRHPPMVEHELCTEIGRVRLPVTTQLDRSTRSSSFAPTAYGLRLMEAIAVCIRENEPALLVGETGTGKTTVLQYLAHCCGRELMVQNLSLQTDSTDLLGGYRPLRIQQVAQNVYQTFVDLFTGTFSRKQNLEFLNFAATALQKEQWMKLSQCFRRAAQLGLSKLKQQESPSSTAFETWEKFHATAERFEKQRVACASGLAFVFSEGALVDAIRKGNWVLLDEINLASSETLQRLCGLLDDSTSSLTLTERGDAVAIERHPSFRLFAAMNPATDAGKKDLALSIRARFTELYVDELLDPVELRIISSRYLSDVLPRNEGAPENSETIIVIVDLYLQCRELADRSLVDGNGQKPRYTLRTLSRALTAARTIVVHQKHSLYRALYEGFQLAFQGPLDEKSLKIVDDVLLRVLGSQFDRSQLDHPGKRPGGKVDGNNFVLVKPFWIENGPLPSVDWSAEDPKTGRSRFILVPSTKSNLRRIARAIASGPWPILLEGPTSVGKTSLVEYIAARCGHYVVRINNHEHTDVQEYTGGFAADPNGLLTFVDGILVRALRLGHWVILDELNLAPSEVLEALNRLLDDNRELYIPELNEIVKPHPNFRLFATQNPSGSYGGRKPLSRAFRNRFVEIQVNDIPSVEMSTILEKRCGCPPSYARILVDVMDSLRHRRSRSGVFLGKDGLITPRDLLRWADRGSSSKLELAQEGYMLLAERLRSPEEQDCVKEVIEKHFKLSLDLDSVYYGNESFARSFLARLQEVVPTDEFSRNLVSTIAVTKSLLRLVTLVHQCVKHREPVLLVGETGCGKTVTFQLISLLLQVPLHIVNCHQTTETSDLIGGLRPVRGRSALFTEIIATTKHLLKIWPEKDMLNGIQIPDVLVASSFEGSSLSSALDLAGDAVSAVIDFVKILRDSAPITDNIVAEFDDRVSKRPKLDESISSDAMQGAWIDVFILLKKLENLFRQYTALFEWVDGPLINCMKRGELILLDEISLTDDAVLERLNSVLEPSRTIVLAEKGMVEGDDSVCVKAMDSFQLFATMNPGGDFGKRELSPALRSRFTEIWVSPVSDLSDIELVLERMLNSCTNHPSSTVVKSRMIEYFDWFNRIICCDPTSLYSGLLLSLRDILTWARFVVESRAASITLNVWEAYRHGARLMHLDGLGLGSGLSSVDAYSIQLRAEAFLSNQMNEEGYADECSQSFDFSVSNDFFGVYPFHISVGSHAIPSQEFNFGAPTTSLNVLRVLRALQISKPILLEGPPGVGKTTLIAAMAKASGHNLVRINLSEQTDISDLIGSDLPVPDNGKTRSVGASFCWFDGILLSAIRNGDWVLLDELNLASQSVLEGLNSCLDHRASVFIPELGKSVYCPPSFRVFAAQNPMGQGGGRKGLPKSFLNRFTKVFVDSLSCRDLQVIVKSRFPDQIFADNFIEFHGVPWEFNLRDIFRWCELFELEKRGNDFAYCGTSRSPLRFARDLYFQRFRTTEDREHCRRLYDTIFNTSNDRIDLPTLLVTDNAVRIGDVSLRRSPFIASMKYDLDDLDLTPRISVLEPMEAVARCVSMNWPCLLVGKSLSGKSMLIHTLAHLTNSSVIEITLSSASDISDLIGSFEQVDWLDDFMIEARKLVSVADEFLLYTSASSSSHSVGVLLHQFRQILKSIRLQYDDGILVALKLSNVLFASMHLNNSRRSKVMELVDAFEKMKSTQKIQQEKGTQFGWKDGGLVRAMEEGSWLHLKNANLCSSSVLDRLNPVLEPCGYLVLSESGVSDVSTTSRHREVRCHPKFRVFLSINPEHGEVSRAMRNRCVEVSLLEVCPKTPGKDFLDDVDDSSLSCLHSAPLNRYLSAFACGHCRPVTSGDHTYTRNVCSLFISILCRGMQGTAMLAAILGLVYNSLVKGSELKGENVLNNPQINAPRPFRRRSNKNAALYPKSTAIQWWARLLAMYSGSSSDGAPVSLAFQNDEEEEFCMLRCFIRDGSVNLELRNRLIFLFMSKLDARLLSRALVGFESLSGTMKSSVQFLTSIRLALWNRSVNFNEEALCVLARRVSQVLKEHLVIERFYLADSKKSVHELTVLEVSFSLSRGKLDRHLVDCPLTPVLFPFFYSFDAWVHDALQFSSAFDNTMCFLVMVQRLLSIRDCLWNHLSECLFSSCKIGRFRFVPNEFVALWSSLKEELETCQAMFDETFRLSKVNKRLDVVIESIEKGVFDRTSDEMLIGSSLMRAAACPVVPRSADLWLVLTNIKNICHSLLVDRKLLLSSRPSTLFVRDFCETFPVLFAVTDSFKSDLLGILCTIQIADVLGAQHLSNSSLPQAVDKIPFVLETSLRQMTASFVSQFASIRMDHESNLESSVESNIYSIADLNSIMVQSESRQNDVMSVTDHALETFSRIQIASGYEFWCERYEESLLKSLCGILIEDTTEIIQERIMHHIVSIKKFVHIAISFSLWDVSDLLPYQVLIWLYESEHLANSDWKRCANRFIPALLCNASKRTWLRSSDLYSVVSFSLESPLFEGSSKHVKRERQQDNDLYVQQTTPLNCVIPMAFSMIGDSFEIELPTHQGITYITLENFPYRLAQSSRVVELLALLDSPMETAPHDVTYLFHEVILGLEGILPQSLLTKISTFIAHNSRKPQGIYESLQTYSSISSSESIRNCVDKVLVPLLHCLEILKDHDRMSASMRTESSALAKIYIGLLRFHLLLPNSPIDPGQAVIAEISYIDRLLSNLGIELASLQLDNSAICGEVNPFCEPIRKVLDEGNQLISKRTGLKADIIERPQSHSTPAFFELYDESLGFARTHFSFETVLSLKDMICSFRENDEPHSRMKHVIHWQLTSEEFCVSMLRKFELYEDIVTPLISSVGIVKHGIDLLVRMKTAPFVDENEGAFAEFACFPQVEIHSFSERLTSLFHSIDVTSRDLHDFKHTLALSILSRFQLEKMVTGLDRTLLKSWFSVVDFVVDGSGETQKEYKCDLDDEEDEILFREQFPNFHKSFEHAEESDNVGNKVIDSELDGPWEASRSFKRFLCLFHEMLFNDCMTPIDDKYRMQMFQLCYNTALKSHQLYGNKRNVCEYDFSTSSGHVMALSLASSNGSQSTIRNMIAGCSHDFYKIPNPEESVKAASPLKRLMAKTVQLLTLFPDNTVLLEILRVCDRIVKLNLQSTALGKVLAGLELILKHAQDWEQHASARVRLGESLVAVSRLVASWRKLELKSWPELLNSREIRFATNGRDHWSRIHSIIRRFVVASNEEPIFTQLNIGTPRWVWKGLTRNSERLTIFLRKPREDLMSILKALDTFCLTSPVGEFLSRLNVLRSFVHQARTESLLRESPAGLIQLSSVLNSLWLYYAQFGSLVSRAIAAQRRSYEVRLEQEVKLAKWDEQTYYAMSESTERNHRKLMQILRDYDKVLEASSLEFIETELNRGVLLDSSSPSDATNLIPTHSLFFCFEADMNVPVPANTEFVQEKSFAREWTDASFLGIEDGFRLKRLSQKMMDLVEKPIDLASNRGSHAVSELYNTIFERIDFLRLENSTQVMKERALTDLFKELRRHGFSAAKWSVPIEMHQMGELFLLPCPSMNTLDANGIDSMIIAKSERYYQRCLAEIYRFRNEVRMFGSDHMTARQLASMLGFCEHGFFLIAQQRCIVSCVLSQRKSLFSLIDSIVSCSGKTLVVHQANCKQNFLKVKREFAHCIESMRQLLLLLKSSQQLFASSTIKHEWFQATVTKLDSFISSTNPISPARDIVLVSSEDMREIEQIRDTLVVGAALLSSCKAESTLRECLPLSAFSSCEKLIETTKKSVLSFLQSTLDSDGLMKADEVPAHKFLCASTEAIDSILVFAQTCLKSATKPNCEENLDDDSFESIWDLHRSTAEHIKALNVQKLSTSVKALLRELESLHDDSSIDKNTRDCCGQYTSDIGVLYGIALSLHDKILSEYAKYYCETTKLQYIILRIFRVLRAKGFCSAKAKDVENGDSGDGTTSGLNFEDDKDGTGMGEGDGKTDVTDQLENEEQLLGLKGDSSNPFPSKEPPETKQLDKDEAAKGMEMEGDFDGEMYDMPDDAGGESSDDKQDNEEEIDREMGHDGSPNEEVIDEKLWDESDDETNADGLEEKFEQNSSVKGDGASDEMMTKDDVEGKDETSPESNKPSSELQEKVDESNTCESEKTNDVTEDLYEENKGVTVRDENRQDDANQTEEGDVDENISIEEDSECLDDQGVDDSMEVDEENGNSSSPPALEPSCGDSESNPMEDEPDINTATERTPYPEIEEKSESQDIEAGSLNNDTPLNNSQRGLGVKDKDGGDIVFDDDNSVQEKVDHSNSKPDDADKGDDQGSTSKESSSTEKVAGCQNGQNMNDNASGVPEEQARSNPPNPLKSPGDASKYWHRKLNMIESSHFSEKSSESLETEFLENKDEKGAFEYATENEGSTSQGLGEADENEALHLDELKEILDDDSLSSERNLTPTLKPETLAQKESLSRSQSNQNSNGKYSELDMEREDIAEPDPLEDVNVDENTDAEIVDPVKDDEPQNRVVSDMSQLFAKDESFDETRVRSFIDEKQQAAIYSSEETSMALSRWSVIQSETQNLSRRLCEKLRLVMEPLVASKLKGDYRTGKRINMKRVIGYVASGYRKDKIWLRRSKPAKRNYRVLLAVDDSESMLKSGAGDMALKAMATLAVGMSQLEVGEIGIARFGNEMDLVHPFHLPFTLDSGVNVVRSFQFKQKRTRTALCIESALLALELTPGDSSSMQLVFMISDGRIERDSRASIRRLIRKMIEQNVLLVLIIVEGSEKGSDSILNMKEVNFKSGKPMVKHFIEDYPFPYYIILDDMQALPEVLGDALRQWFEMIARVQTNSS